MTSIDTYFITHTIAYSQKSSICGGSLALLLDFFLFLLLEALLSLNFFEFFTVCLTLLLLRVDIDPFQEESLDCL